MKSGGCQILHDELKGLYATLISIKLGSVLTQNWEGRAGEFMEFSVKGFD